MLRIGSRCGSFWKTEVHKTSEINTVAVLRFHGGGGRAAQPDCKATSVGRKATRERSFTWRLVKLRSLLVTSLLMLTLSTVIWGAVYLLNSTLLR